MYTGGLLHGDRNILEEELERDLEFIGVHRK
jgi:hypothetical protein